MYLDAPCRQDWPKTDSKIVGNILTLRAQCDRLVRYCKHQSEQWYPTNGGVKAILLYSYGIDRNEHKMGNTCGAWTVDDMTFKALEGAKSFALEVQYHNGDFDMHDVYLKNACPFEGIIHEDGNGNLIIDGKPLTKELA